MTGDDDAGRTGNAWSGTEEAEASSICSDNRSANGDSSGKDCTELVV